MTIKDRQAQEYAEKKIQETIPECYLHDEQIYDADDIKDDYKQAYHDGYTIGYTDGYTAAEQSMTDGEAPVIQRWVARDRDDNTLWMYSEKPLRDGNKIWYGKEPINLPTDFFPSLTWSDEPIECEILIKPKKR